MTRAPDSPLPKWGRVQAMRGRRPPPGSAALPVSSPSQMGRGTVRSLAEAKEGGGAPAARSSLPLHHPSDGPPPHSLREQGGDGMLTIRRLSAYSALLTYCSHTPFKNYSVTNHPRRGPCQTPVHPVGGEGVGSSAPMSAGCGRAMKPGGRIPRGSLRRSMDGLRLLAARQWSGPLAVPCPSRVPGSNVRDG